MTWVRTYSGKRIDLIYPLPEMIDFNDMALALSRICRFNGHTPVFYSVLQHSLEVAKLFDRNDPAFKYAALHDCHEAVTGDITTPVKQVLDQSYPALTELQTRLDSAIFAAAGLLPTMPPDIRRRVFAADATVLRWELIDVLRVSPEVYEVPDLQEFPDHTTIVPADRPLELCVAWLEALELPVTRHIRQSARENE